MQFSNFHCSKEEFSLPEWVALAMMSGSYTGEGFISNEYTKTLKVSNFPQTAASQSAIGCGYFNLWDRLEILLTGR